MNIFLENTRPLRLGDVYREPSKERAYVEVIVYERTTTYTLDFSLADLLEVQAKHPIADLDVRIEGTDEPDEVFIRVTTKIYLTPDQEGACRAWGDARSSVPAKPHLNDHASVADFEAYAKLRDEYTAAVSRAETLRLAFVTPIYDQLNNQKGATA